MTQLSHADRIWNRACGEDPVRTHPGDRALCDMLRTHGLIMNGGVLHAIECLTSSAQRDAEAGYCFYGLDAVASILACARAISEAGKDLGEHERQLDAQYVDFVPSDSSLVALLEQYLKLKPAEFAFLRTRD